MDPHCLLSLIFTVLGLCCAIAAGVCFVLVGLELKRKSRPTPFLTVTLNVRKKIDMYKQVLSNYRELKQDEGRPAVLPKVMWTSDRLPVCTKAHIWRAGSTWATVTTHLLLLDDSPAAPWRTVATNFARPAADCHPPRAQSEQLLRATLVR